MILLYIHNNMLTKKEYSHYKDWKQYYENSNVVIKDKIKYHKSKKEHKDMSLMAIQKSCKAIIVFLGSLSRKTNLSHR